MEGGGGKLVKQCWDKMDLLKKWYKLERGRKVSIGVEMCGWMWFDKMDGMFGDYFKYQSVLFGFFEVVEMKFFVDKF